MFHTLIHTYSDSQTDTAFIFCCESSLIWTWSVSLHAVVDPSTILSTPNNLNLKGNFQKGKIF